MSMFIPKEPYSSCQESVLAGREHAHPGWWMALGKVECTKKWYSLYPGICILGKRQMQFSR